MRKEERENKYLDSDFTFSVSERVITSDRLVVGRFGNFNTRININTKTRRIHLSQESISQRPSEQAKSM